MAGIAAAAALTVPLLLLPVPADTDAQGFGYLSLMIRRGGTLTTLAPWHPEIRYLYTPGALLIFAGLSQILQPASISAVMMGSAHAAALLFVWLSWSFGRELARHSTQLGEITTDKPQPARLDRWGLIAGLSAALSVGMWTALLDSHYTAVFGLLFTLAWMLCTLRYLRLGRKIDVGLTALFLAAVCITHPDSAFALALSYAAMLVLSPFAADRPSPVRWLTMALAVPGLALASLTPWLLEIISLIEAGIRSPFTADLAHWKVLIAYHGLIWPLLALLGAALIIRRRPTWVLSMGGWLVLLAAMSLFDATRAVSGTPLELLFRFNYPFSLAWHGPILPYLALGAAALVWLSRNIETKTLSGWITWISVGAMALLALGLSAHRPLLAWSKGRLHAYGSLSSANDLAAMRWIRDHSPPEARALNYPGDYPAGRDWEAHWAPAIAERDSVYFRWQPFFLVRGLEPGDPGSIADEQIELLSFWRDPADPAHAARLCQHHIHYVLVPEAIGDPRSWFQAWRWRPPARLPEPASGPEQAPYLELVYRAGGAQVFRFSP
jgi:hypothetical protein